MCGQDLKSTHTSQYHFCLLNKFNSQNFQKNHARVKNFLAFNASKSLKANQLCNQLSVALNPTSRKLFSHVKGNSIACSCCLISWKINFTGQKKRLSGTGGQVCACGQHERDPETGKALSKHLVTFHSQLPIPEEKQTFLLVTYKESKKKKKREEKRSTLLLCDQSQLVLEMKRFHYQKCLSINLLGNQAFFLKFQACSPKPSITSENPALNSMQAFCYLQQQNSKVHQFSTWPKKTSSLFMFPITNLKPFLPLDYMPASYHCYLL